MVLGAIAKAAAKGAAKGAAKAKAKAKSVSRAAKAGDEAYNARRRYTRAAERNLKKAESSTGATAARYRYMATEQLKAAVNTYDKSTTQKISAPIQNLADRLGVNLDQQRRNLKARTDESATNVRDRLIRLSERQLESNLNRQGEEQRRQDEARATLNNDAIGSRILGGTVNIWKDKATVNGKVDKKKILPALYEHFKVDNLADLLLQLENLVGDLLYNDADSDVMYETVKLTIQKSIRQDNSVAA